jgi:hypothetical protein
VAPHLLAARRHIAELEQVRDPPVAGLELDCGLAGVPSGGDHRRRGVQALLEAVRTPEGDVAGVERVRERSRVAGGLRARDRLGAQRLRGVALRRVVELDGEARLEAGTEHAVTHGLDGLLEPRDGVGVKVDDGDAEAGEADGRLGEQLAVAAPARQSRRGGERLARRRGLSRAQQRVPAREQHRPELVLRARQLERLERSLEALGGVLVGQPVERAPPGSDQRVGGPAGIGGRGSLEEVRRDLF